MKVDIVIRGSQATSQQRCVLFLQGKEKPGRLSDFLSRRFLESTLGQMLMRAAGGGGHVDRAGAIFYTSYWRLYLFGLVEVVCGDDVRCGTVSASFHQPGTAGRENQAAGEIGVLSGRQVSTCWISGGKHFPKDLGWYFRIFWRVLGQIFPSATHRPPPLRLHKSAVDCRKKEMVSPWNQMEMWWDIQSLAEQAQALPRECDTM